MEKGDIRERFGSFPAFVTKILSVFFQEGQGNFQSRIDLALGMELIHLLI